MVHNHMDAAIMCCDWDPDLPCILEGDKESDDYIITISKYIYKVARDLNYKNTIVKGDKVKDRVEVFLLWIAAHNHCNQLRTDAVFPAEMCRRVIITASIWLEMVGGYMFRFTGRNLGNILKKPHRSQRHGVCCHTSCAGVLYEMTHFSVCKGLLILPPEADQNRTGSALASSIDMTKFSQQTIN